MTSQTLASPDHPAPPAPFPTLRAALRVMAACVELRRRGARLRGARVTPQTVILIDAPGPGIIPAYGYRPPPRRGDPVCCIAHLGGVRVEWLSRGERP